MLGSAAIDLAYIASGGADTLLNHAQARLRHRSGQTFIARGEGTATTRPSSPRAPRHLSSNGLLHQVVQALYFIRCVPFNSSVRCPGQKLMPRGPSTPRCWRAHTGWGPTFAFLPDRAPREAIHVLVGDLTGTSGEDPTLVIGQDLAGCACSLLGPSLHKSLEVGGAVFAREMDPLALLALTRWFVATEEGILPDQPA